MKEKLMQLMQEADAKMANIASLQEAEELISVPSHLGSRRDC